MYTHARQFPHLAGKSDDDIRSLARRGMQRRPHLIRITQVRNAVVFSGLMITAALWGRFTNYSLGLGLMLAGGVSTIFLLAWNLVWVNTVLFRITEEETQRGPAERTD